MATEVVMPQMGESIAEGTITKWLKKVGDRVERDEPLFEISTDKVDAEIPSPAAGTLTEIRFKEGETVEINTTVAVLDGSAAGAATDAAPAAEAAAFFCSFAPPGVRVSAASGAATVSSARWTRPGSMARTRACISSMRSSEVPITWNPYRPRLRCSCRAP